MPLKHFPTIGAARTTSLAACIAALLGLSAPATLAATTHPITSCDDSGLGTLRTVVGHPWTLSGDTVDLSGLTITGKYHGVVENDRLFTHTGYGTLSLSYLVMDSGSVDVNSGIAFGGCILSRGNIALLHDTITSCTACGKLIPAIGRAVAAFGSVGMLYTNIVNSTAASIYGYAAGGGVFGYSGVTAKYSTIAYNIAGGGAGVGRRIYSKGTVGA